MARARLLKPGFFTNDELLELPVEARLLFAGLWTIADREGRLQDRPKRIKIELFPADHFDVDLLLWALENAGFIHRYTVADTKLIHIPSFLKHQTPHLREAQSTLPACGCEAMNGPEAQGEHSASPEKAMPSPAVAVPIAVAVPESVPEAVTGTEAVEPDGGDPAFRDKYGTMTTAFGGQLDARLCDEFAQLAEEATLDGINAAIRACRSENVRPWPSAIRQRLPSGGTPSENPFKKSAAVLAAARERMA